MRIIKYIKPILWAIGFSLFSANGTAASVSFGINDYDVQINEAFTVDVLVSGIDPLDEVIAFGFDLIFDPSWSLDSVTIGPDFDFDDSALFANTAIAGSIDPLNSGPNGDNIVLASIQLTPSKAGDFNLEIISDLSDFNEGLYLFSSFDAFDLSHNEQIAINSTSPVPIPGGLFLFCSGIVFLLRYKTENLKVLGGK